MKKILSCVLAIALVFSLMSMTVFADTPTSAVDGDEDVPGSYWVAGFAGRNQGTVDSVDDGVASFDDKTTSGSITVNFTTDNDPGTVDTMEDRYALDIEYKDLIIDLTHMKKADGAQLENKYVWDVNAHEYVLLDNNGDVIQDPAPDMTPIVIEAYTITNHSSKSIFYKAAIDNLVNDAITMTINETSTEVERATTGQATTLAAWETITAAPKTAEGWLASVNKLAETKQTGDQIGTITITFSMAAIPTV